MLELEEQGLQEGRLHDHAEVEGPRETTTYHFQPGGVTSGPHSYFKQILKQGADPASHANGKGAQQGARAFTPTRVVFSSDGQQEGLDISVTVVPPVASVPSQGRQPREAEAPVEIIITQGGSMLVPALKWNIFYTVAGAQKGIKL